MLALGEWYSCRETAAAAAAVVVVVVVVVAVVVVVVVVNSGVSTLGFNAHWVTYY